MSDIYGVLMLAVGNTPPHPPSPKQNAHLPFSVVSVLSVPEKENKLSVMYIDFRFS